MSIPPRLQTGIPVGRRYFHSEWHWGMSQRWTTKFFTVCSVWKLFYTVLVPTKILKKTWRSFHKSAGIPLHDSCYVRDVSVIKQIQATKYNEWHSIAAPYWFVSLNSWTYNLTWKHHKQKKERNYKILPPKYSHNTDKNNCKNL